MKAELAAVDTERLVDSSGILKQSTPCRVMIMDGIRGKVLCG